ncbi:MAG: squalene/phytoene synthase family protein [Candidatus Poseidoniales archaeon]|nr:MAG: squalene/phytoene synthase family protein [Candidatus Poseidoniales archaeon]
MSSIFNSDLDSILEGTSRSFYLSLKELPREIRKQVSLLYMLARTSDTIADSEGGEPEDLLQALESYNEFTQGNTDEAPDLQELSEFQSNISEGLLLKNVDKVASNISQFSESDQESIRNCLGTIIGGQILDLKRFSSGVDGIPSIEENDELDDYAYRVAGSVGEFWTQMSLDHLFKIKEENEAEIFENGVRFGKALQMINILRDIPADLELGRCYIPRRSLDEHGMSPSDLLDSSKMESFRPLYNEYLDLTDQHLDSAVQYIEMLPHSQFRLRGSCMLPVIIGKKTVSLLRGRNVLDPEKKVKISRSEVKEVVKKVIMAVPFKGSSKRLLRE